MDCGETEAGTGKCRKGQTMKMIRYAMLVLMIVAMTAVLTACNQATPTAPSTPSASQRSAPAASVSGKVIDAEGKPLKGAIVTLNGSEVILTDENGSFTVKQQVSKVAARAHGYSRAELVMTDQQKGRPIELKLKPVTPKALYLTVYGIGSRTLREAALNLIEQTELNALVIDVKGDRGLIPYKSAVPLAGEIGAQKVITVKDMKETVQSLRERGIYTTARIVVFKDDLLGTAKPELAVKAANGTAWRDRERLIWVDPSRKEVWDYTIAVAIEAAQMGFDEIQFDYVRFPDHKGLVFGVPNTEENRVKHIAGFLAEAKKKLEPYNVFISADIFGYVAWNQNDTDIGQKLDAVAPSVDYISLMLYPSGFQFGIPGYRNPVANSGKIVYLTLERARERTNLPAVRFRPWLQAFRDYAFDRRHFTGVQIREQIKAAEDFGSSGWMLWNPRNIYSADGLKKKPASQKAEQTSGHPGKG